MPFPEPYTCTVTSWTDVPGLSGVVLQTGIPCRQLKPLIPLWEREFDYFSAGFLHRWCLGPEFNPPKTGLGTFGWGGENWGIHLTVDPQYNQGWHWYYRIQSIEQICVMEVTRYWYLLLTRQGLAEG